MISLIIASLIAFLSAFLGGLAHHYSLRIKKETLRFSHAFSAGLLISIALVHLLPESGIEKNYLFALIGFFLFYSIIALTHSGGCSEVSCEVEHPETGLLIWTGISLHALFDGVAMGAGFSASEKLGTLIAFAILIHKAPIGFSLSAILASRGIKDSKALFFLFLFSLVTPIGALISALFLSIKQEVLQVALAFSGGTFLHISIAELLPDVHNEEERKVVLYVLCGALLGLIPRFFGIH